MNTPSWTRHFALFCLFPLLALGMASSLQSCSSQENAGGTASEGESFVYGYVRDSSLLAAMARRSSATTDSGTRVTLSRQTYTDSGLAAIWSDSVWAAPDGYFSIAVPDSGVYTLVAKAANGASAVYAEIGYITGALNLGNLGLFNLATVQGTMRGAPTCSGGLQLSMLGFPFSSLMAEDSSFTLTGVPRGYATLLAQCDDTVQQWQVILPGTCPSVVLDSLEWDHTNSADSSSICNAVTQSSLDSLLSANYGYSDIMDSLKKQGYSFSLCNGFNNSSSTYRWNWQQRETLVIGPDCHMMTVELEEQ